MENRSKPHVVGFMASIGFVLATLVTPATVVAGDSNATQAVTLTEVASQVAPTATRLPNLMELLRTSVEAELKTIDWRKEGLRNQYKLSASIVQLETSPGDKTLKVFCTVSAAVRDAKGGTLLAIVQGKARAEASAAARVSAEQGVLEGAVRGAISALPEAIRKAQ